MKIFQNKYIQVISALVLFLLATIIYFHPVLEGKELVQGDITRSLATSKEIRDFRATTGEEPLWTNSQFGGMPAFQMNTEYPNNWMKLFDKGLKANLPSQIGLIFTIMIGFYVLAKSYKINNTLSIAGAIAFGLSTFFIVSLEAGHNSKLRAIAYIAPIIAGVITTYKGKHLLGAAITCFSVALSIYANHFQITYYTIMVLLVIAIVYLINAIKKKTIKQFIVASAILLIAGLAGVGPNISKIWSTYEYSKETIRGGKSELTEKKETTSGGLDFDYAMSWSYGKMETFNLLIPELYGGASSGALDEDSEVFEKFRAMGYPAKEAKKVVEHLPLYWGDQPITSGPVYIGAIFIFLFVLGMFIIKGPTKWWLLGATIMAIILAWGKHFHSINNLFFEYFPMYNKFRTPSMILTIACLTIPFGAMLAVNHIMNLQDKSSVKKHLMKAFYIVGGLCLLFLVGGASMFDFSGASDIQLEKQGWPIDALISDRKSLLINAALKSLIFVSIAFGVVYAYIHDKLKSSVLTIGLSVLCVIDIWSTDKRYLNANNFETSKNKDKAYAMDTADKMIKKDKDLYYRVVDFTVNPFTDALTSYHHKSIGGYHGAKLFRYQDLIEHHLSKQNMSVYNMLNTKYFIVPDQQKKRNIAQRNGGALGNAWFVDSLIIAENADQEIQLLNDINPAREAVIDQRYASDLPTISLGGDNHITLTSYKPNELVYEANVQKDNSLAIFSEIYYEGGNNDWKTYIDDQPTSHFRTNYLLRGMVLPQGKHTVRFKFEPESYFAGEKYSLIFSILVLALLIGALFIEFRKNKTELEAA